MNQINRTVLNTQQIMQMLPQRYPFLFVDEVIHLIPGEQGIGVKNVTANEPYFQGHFPQQMIMPGVLIVEASAQLAGIVLSSRKNKDEYECRDLEYLASIQKFYFKDKVVPGNQLLIEVSGFKHISNFVQVAVQAKVKNKIVAEGLLVITNQKLT